MVKKLLHEAVRLEIDLATSTVRGRAELDVQQRADQRQLQLHCKQCDVTKCSVNGVDSKFYLGAPMSKIVADEVMARDIQNYKLALKRAIDSSQEGELRIIIDGGQQPEKADNGEMGYGVWKVVVEFTLTKPQGGIIFAGGGDLPGWGARHCFTDGQPGVSALWFPTIDALHESCPFVLEVTVQAGLKVLCSLPLSGEERINKRKKLTFKSAEGDHIPAKSLAFAVGPFVSVFDPGAPQKLAYYCLPGPHAEQVLSHSTQFVCRALAAIENLTGCPIPCENHGHATVFVDNAYVDVHSCPSLCIASSSLLHDSTVVEQAFDTARKLVHGLVQQWFGLGALVRPESSYSLWLVQGLAGHVTNLCLRKLLGNNAYVYHVFRETEATCATDTTLVSNSPMHPFETMSVDKERKATLVMRLIEKRMGEANFRKLLGMLLQRAWNGKGRELNMERFFKAARKCSGIDIEASMSHWWSNSRCPVFTCNFYLNRKRNQIEFAMRVHQGASRAKRLDSMTVRVFETEVTYERTVGVDEEFITDEYPHISKSRKNKRDREAEKEGEPELIKELMDKFESPLLWMRVDPELLWIRKINFKQSDFMWVYQLYKDKNVAAQVEAINGLGSIITSSTVQAPASDFHRYLVVRCLSETLDDSHNYHEVRSYAAATLGRLCCYDAADAGGLVQWIGVQALLKHIKTRYIDHDTGLPRPNSFANVADYLVKKSVIRALANARLAGGASVSAEVFETIYWLLKHNDNSRNEFSDGEYIACLISSLATCTTDLPGEVRKASKQLERYMKRDWTMPSYGHAVTCASLEASRILMERGLVPVADQGLSEFLKHAKVGNSPQVRSAAVRCLAKLSPRQPVLLDRLLLLATVEKVPSVRLSIMEALLDGPAQLIAKLPELSMSNATNIHRVETMWEFLNEGSAYDIRCRYAMASVYVAMFGEGVPACMRFDCAECGFVASEICAVPSSEQMATLRASKKEMKLKLKIAKKGKRLGQAEGGELAGAGAWRQQQQQPMSQQSQVEKHRRLLEQEREAEAAKAAKESSERAKRKEERERIQNVTSYTEGFEVFAPPPPPRPNWPLDNPTKHVAFRFKVTPPPGRGNTPPPEHGWHTPKSRLNPKKQRRPPPTPTSTSSNPPAAAAFPSPSPAAVPIPAVAGAASSTSTTTTTTTTTTAGSAAIAASNQPPPPSTPLQVKIDNPTSTPAAPQPAQTPSYVPPFTPTATGSVPPTPTTAASLSDQLKLFTKSQKEKKRHEPLLNWPLGRDVVKTKHVKFTFVVGSAPKETSLPPAPAAAAPASVAPAHAPVPVAQASSSSSSSLADSVHAPAAAPVTAPAAQAPAPTPAAPEVPPPENKKKCPEPRPGVDPTELSRVLKVKGLVEVRSEGEWWNAIIRCIQMVGEDLCDVWVEYEVDNSYDSGTVECFLVDLTKSGWSEQEVRAQQVDVLAHPPSSAVPSAVAPAPTASIAPPVSTQTPATGAEGGPVAHLAAGFFNSSSNGASSVPSATITAVHKAAAVDGGNTSPHAAAASALSSRTSSSSPMNQRSSTPRMWRPTPRAQRGYFNPAWDMPEFWFDIIDRGEGKGGFSMRFRRRHRFPAAKRVAFKLGSERTVMSLEVGLDESCMTPHDAGAAEEGGARPSSCASSGAAPPKLTGEGSRGAAVPGEVGGISLGGGESGGKGEGGVEGGGGGAFKVVHRGDQASDGNRPAKKAKLSTGESSAGHQSKVDEETEIRRSIREKLPDDKRQGWKQVWADYNANKGDTEQVLKFRDAVREACRKYAPEMEARVDAFCAVVVNATIRGQGAVGVSVAEGVGRKESGDCKNREGTKSSERKREVEVEREEEIRRARQKIEQERQEKDKDKDKDKDKARAKSPVVGGKRGRDSQLSRTSSSNDIGVDRDKDREGRRGGEGSPSRRSRSRERERERNHRRDERDRDYERRERERRRDSRSRSRGRERHRSRSRSRGGGHRSRSRSRERERRRSRERERERRRSHSRSRSRDRDRRSKSRDRDRDRRQSRSRERERRSRSRDRGERRSRSRDRGRDRGYERDRERDRSREKGRDSKEGDKRERERDSRDSQRPSSSDSHKDGDKPGTSAAGNSTPSKSSNKPPGLPPSPAPSAQAPSPASKQQLPDARPLSKPAVDSSSKDAGSSQGSFGAAVATRDGGKDSTTTGKPSDPSARLPSVSSPASKPLSSPRTSAASPRLAAQSPRGTSRPSTPSQKESKNLEKIALRELDAKAGKASKQVETELNIPSPVASPMSD